MFSIIYDNDHRISYWGNSLDAHALITAHGDDIAFSKSLPELAVGENELYDLAREVAGLERLYKDILSKK